MLGQWRAAFAEVIDPRFYSIEWVEIELAAGLMTLLEGREAALLVALKQYPAGASEVHAMAAVGDLSEIIGPLRERAEAWGRERGAIVAGVDSRPGWARALWPHGYGVHQVCLRKEL